MHPSSTKPDRKRGRPTSFEIEAIDSHILAAGFEVFKQVGFDGASMETIAANAEITKATLYRRYPNKAALLAAVMASLSKDLAATVATIGEGGTALDRLKRLMQAYRTRAAHPDQIALQRLGIAVLPYQPNVADALTLLRVGYVAPVDRLIEEAVRAGLLDDLPTIRIREAMFDLLVNGVASLAMVGGQSEIDDAAFEFGWNILLKGLPPPRHRPTGKNE
jgi:AcrR family transcriptional regulator